MNRPEGPAGPVVGVTVLATFAATIVLAATHQLFGVLGWLLTLVVDVETVRHLAGWAALVALVVGAVAWARRGGGRLASALVHGGRRAHVIKHEALGHAAVAHGVGAGNIRARLIAGGGGEVTCDVHRMSPAEYVAYMRAGRYVAPGDCHADDANAQGELNRAAPGEREAISREADAIVRRHVGSAFGQRVARALECDGRFR